jgi:hypothetical protein
VAFPSPFRQRRGTNLQSRIGISVVPSPYKRDSQILILILLLILLLLPFEAGSASVTTFNQAIRYGPILANSASTRFFTP